MLSSANEKRVEAKSRIIRGFRKGRQSYDAAAVVQHRIADELIAMLGRYGRVSYNKALEIGCCTGYLTEKAVLAFSLASLFINDIVADFQNDVEKRIRHLDTIKIVPCFGDIETVSLPTDLDLIFSSATLQWIDDLAGLFRRLAHSLREDGILAFSIQGPKTLYEFKEVTGIGLIYRSLSELLLLLEQEYEVLSYKHQEETMILPTPRHILKHLQATGVNGVADFRWTPSSLKNFEKDYIRYFAGKSGVPVSYESYLFIVKKAH